MPGDPGTEVQAGKDVSRQGGWTAPSYGSYTFVRDVPYARFQRSHKPFKSRISDCLTGA